MIKIDVKKVLKAAAEQKLVPKALPKIVVGKGTTRSEVTKRIIAETPKEVKEEVRDYGHKIVSLVSQCWEEFNAMKLERKMLSTQIHKLVSSGATTAQLREQYEKIEAYQLPLQELFDRARYVEQYGKLPEPVAPDIDIILLKDKRKKLVDLRCKLSKKVEDGTKLKHKKLIEWQVELDQANAQYDLVDLKIKKLEGKA